MNHNREQDFTAFYKETWRGTVASAYAVLGDRGTAEEVAQDAYAKAWSRWAQLCDYDDPRGWVRRVAIRQAISRWRRARTALRHLPRSPPPDIPPPSENTVVVVAALLTLPEPQRRALALHHLGEFSVAEIAEIEHCPPGTIKARLSRGRQALAGRFTTDAERARPPGCELPAPPSRG